MNENNGDLFDKAISEKEDAQRRERLGDVLQRDYDEQQAMLADSENADRADRETAAKKQIFMRNLMGVIVKRSGGGPISPRLATWANGVLQKAGVKDGGIMAGGGFGKDGRFVIPTYGMDANGAQVPGQGIAYDGKSLFTMMNQLRGIFSDDDISRGAEFLRKSGVGEKEIASMSYNPFATMLSDRDRARREMMTRQPTDPDHIKNRMGGGAGGREVGSTTDGKAVSRLFGRTGFVRPTGITQTGFAYDGKGGSTRYYKNWDTGETWSTDHGTRDPNYKGRWKVLSSGPRRINDAYVDENGQRHEAEYENGKLYVNDKTGEEVFVRDGETPPWSNGGMSEKERIARMQDEGRTQRATDKNNTQLKVQQLRNLAKELGYKLDEKQLEEKVRHNKAVEEGGAKTQGARASKDQADAAAKELAAVRKSIESETDEKRKKELRARESQLQSVVDSFAGIGGGGSEKPVSAADRFGSGGDKGTAPAAAPKGQETPAGGKPNGDAVQGDGGQQEEPVRPSVKEEIITVDEYKKLPDDEKRKFRLRSNPKIKEGGYVYSRYVSIKQPASEDSPEHSSVAQTKVEQRSMSSMKGQEPEKKGEQGGSEEQLTPAEKSVGKEAVAKFKKLHPEVTDVDENPDKYDKQLTRIAQNLSGDYSFTSGSAKKRAEEQRKAQEEKRVAQEKKWQEERDARLKAIDESDKAVVKKVTDMYGPLYEKARDLALEDDGGDYPKAVRKRFAELVKDYNDENDVKFDNFWNPGKNPFGEYHIADLLSDVFGDDAGVYIGSGGYKGRAQRRLKTHKANG